MSEDYSESGTRESRTKQGNQEVQYVIVKAPPHVCMKNTARGGVSRG